MKQHDLSYWEDLAERYFLAETSEREEAKLRKFLCSDAANDPRFDEVKATMSLLYVSRLRTLPQRGRRRGLSLRWVAVAACLCLAAFLGWHQYQQHNMNYVRIAGEDVEADASLLMQRQMTEMFNPIENDR